MLDLIIKTIKQDTLVYPFLALTRMYAPPSWLNIQKPAHLVAIYEDQERSLVTNC